MSEIRLAPGVTVANAALTFSTARSSGPGGQNVNKTESKVELRLRITAIVGLSWRAQDRLVMLAGSRLTADGDLIMTCDETRSQRTNREMVIERLSELVRDAQAVPKPRKRTKPGRGSIERRLRDKAAVSDKKRERRPDDH
ncbi:MAG: aminoacyl-tRNA hydrolase [Planctomycetes bacterium]|nr:aminoacyl-tRNA hydrolase [Planctomycetota bacterium]